MNIPRGFYLACDCSLTLLPHKKTSGTAYLTTFPYLMQKYGLNFANERGTNMLDSGAHFYEVYKTKDGLYMAV